jgi:hypothetical protein
VYQQKVKHLQYEHSNTVEAVKREGDEKLQRQDTAHEDRAESLKVCLGSCAPAVRRSDVVFCSVVLPSQREKRNYKMELKELQLRHEEEIKALQGEQVRLRLVVHSWSSLARVCQEKNLAKIRETNAKELELLREKYDARLVDLQEDLDLRQRMVHTPRHPQREMALGC